MMKSRGITGILTSLSHDAQRESSSVAVSSVVDTWLLLRNVESDGERNRLLFVMKSRGTAHSNQVREFRPHRPRRRTAGRLRRAPGVC